MKKLIIPTIAIVALSFINLSIVRNSEATNLSLAIQNLRAIADGEVEVGPLCAHVTNDMCIWLDPIDPSNDFEMPGTFVYKSQQSRLDYIDKQGVQSLINISL